MLKQILGPQVMQKEELRSFRSSVFRNITPCSQLKVKQRFGGKCLHLNSSLFVALLLSPEDVGGMFVQTSVDLQRN
jgi:hypothetical protein